MPQLRTPRRLRGFDYSTPARYFITFSVWNRVKIFLNPECARIAQRCLLTFRTRGWLLLFAYCIMPDHIHALIRLRKRTTLARVVATLKNEIKRTLRLRNLDVKWKPGFYDRVLRPSEQMTNIARYIVENPVRAGLVTESGHYPFGGIVDEW